MARHLSVTRATLLGLFIVVGLGLLFLGIFAIGRDRWAFRPTFTMMIRFPKIGGIIEGTRVRVQGINAGLVDEIIPPVQPREPVTVVIRVDDALRGLIRTDATATLVTQGVVGAKVIEIDPGSPAAPQLPAQRDAIIQGHALEVSDVVEQVNDLVAHVQRGEGSLGKFIIDDDAHLQMLALLKQGEKTLRTLDEDLMAVRNVWPLSTYFQKLGLHDGQQLLFRPGSEVRRRILPSFELFEPGGAALRPNGHKPLNEAGAWLNTFRHSNSEIVIAAFTSTQESEEKARILTQSQAETVRNYLVENFSIDATGEGFLNIFNNRKVTAAGLGSQNVSSDPDSGSLPKDRIELVVFVSL